MKVISRTLWLAATNAYLVVAEGSTEALIIDAPPAIDEIADLLTVEGLVASALLLTHGHIDHSGGAGRLVRETGATAFVHPDDDFLTLDPKSQLSALFGGTIEGDFAPADRYSDLRDGQLLTLSGIDLEVLHTPGHTPGHCCFAIPTEGTLFSGDQLFAGSIGRTDLPGGDYDQLMRSMVDKVLPMDDDTMVYPGHGPLTTLGAERLSNPFLQGLS